MRIQFAFFRSKRGGLFSKAVTWRTGGDHSHVEMIFPQYKIYDPKKDRLLSLCFSSYEKEGGVRFKFIYLDPEKWGLVPYEIPEHKLPELLAFAASLCDAKYDWAGIFGFVLPFVRQRPTHFFCSEVVVYVIQHVLNEMTDIKSYKTSPAALFKYLTQVKH